MTPRALEEFKALRDTVRSRGTARVWVFLAGLVGWGALTIATASLAALPVATFLPLLIISITFEAVFSLHVGVERIGRYIQVFLEDDGNGWEHVAMALGPLLAASPIRCHRYFILATLLNIVPAILAQPVPLEVGVVAACNLVFVARPGEARRVTPARRRSRAFTELKDKAGKAGGPG